MTKLHFKSVRPYESYTFRALKMCFSLTIRGFQSAWLLVRLQEPGSMREETQPKSNALKAS